MALIYAKIAFPPKRFLSTRNLDFSNHALICVGVILSS